MFINLWITVFVRLYFYVYLFKKSQEKDAQNISPIFRLFNNDTSEELIFLLAMLEVSLLVLIIALFLFFIFYIVMQLKRRFLLSQQELQKIGRASCRERV